MSLKLYYLGRACFRARRRVVAAWMLLLMLVGVGVGVMGTALDSGFSIPGTPAQLALDDLERTFPQTAAGAAQVVVHVDDGDVTSDEVKREVDDALVEIADMDGVASVFDPYTGDQVVPPGTDAPELPEAPDVVQPTHVSEDRSTVYAQVQFDEAADDVSDDLKDDLVDAMTDVEAIAGVETSFGGEVFRDLEVHFSAVELIGVLVALVVLIVTFRSFVSALLPIGTALVGVAVSTGAVLLTANVITVSSSAPTLGMMIGLAVGIDYALFIVSRHRELLADGLDADEAAARATATGGGAVVFAGATVVIALCGLSIAQIPFLTVMGLGAALAVVVSVCVALTLLPATLGIAGERLRPKSHRGETDGPVSRRWSLVVARLRYLVAAGVTVFLLVCAIPSADLALTLPDNGTQEAGSTQREAYDTISGAFGPGYNAPLTVSANILQSTDPLATIDELATELSEVDGVAAVTSAVPNEGADTAVFQLVPETGASDPETRALVDELRSLAEERDDWAEVDLAITGQTAVNIDVSEQLAEALVPFGAVVVGLSLILLTLVFRSLLVPLMASLGYLLSTAASFGAVALVFEHGWLADQIGVEKTGPVISFLPIMLMGVLFGLAMDYQVFLVSRMREHYVHGGTAAAAVRAGIRTSSTVVVAAAVIMVAVFAAFVPTGDATLQPIAFALAVGVLLDAFLVRLTLIPSVMNIVGASAWWLPRWLERRLPELDIEGAALQEGLEQDTPALPAAEDVLVSTRGVLVEVRGDRYAVEDFDLHPGALVSLVGERVAAREFLWNISGRGRPADGRLLVAGRPADALAGRPLIGIGGVAGLPASGRTRAELTATEPSYAEHLRALTMKASLFAAQADAATGPDFETGALAQVLENLAWGLAAGVPVVVVELPALAAQDADLAWQLLALAAFDDHAVVVASAEAPADVPTARLRPVLATEPRTGTDRDPSLAHIPDTHATEVN